MPERKMWNLNEDRILRFLKEEQKEKKWSVIARKMHTDFGIEGRTGKQCRERLTFFYLGTTTTWIVQLPLLNGASKRNRLCCVCMNRSAINGRLSLKNWLGGISLTI